MLHCVWDKMGQRQIVVPTRFKELLNTGNYFDCPQKARDYYDKQPIQWYKHKVCDTRFSTNDSGNTNIGIQIQETRCSTDERRDACPEPGSQIVRRRRRQLPRQDTQRVSDATTIENCE